MRRLSWMLLSLLVLIGCAQKKKVTPVEVGNTKELKESTTKKIVWEKDGAKMALVLADPFEMGASKNEPED